MTEFMQFLIEHGYLLIFVWVALDQLGLPLPAIPLILAAGALAGTGELTFGWIIVVSVLAAVPIDVCWYLLGRSKGAKVLNLVCSISLEPDFCVRNTEQLFFKLGLSSVIIAKFLPGLQTLAPPMAGLTGMKMSTFVVLDVLGTVIWTCIFGSIGFIFHNELELIASKITELGAVAAYLFLAVVAIYIGVKLLRRRLFLRSLRMRRLDPIEVNKRMNSDEDIHIIDLRHRSDYDQLPQMIPGAVRVPMEAIDQHYQHIPKNADIILYCS